MKTQFSTADNQGPAPVTDVLSAGDKAGPWIVEHELGRGGMGAVYAVVHEEIGKRAALKVLHRLLVPSFNADRMLLEAKVVNQVGHPNIVDIFETGHLVDGRPFIVMERLDGQSLSHRADEAKILPDQVIALLLQMCDALIAAHAAGIVHRDLKLDNVFLCNSPEDSSPPRVKILDWGIAKVIAHGAHHTFEGQLVGTPQYLSPEQARGAAVSVQTDVYSLGVMAYELFLEQLPFEAETSAEVMAMHLRTAPPPPSDLWPDIPAQLEALLQQMLAKEPDQRPTMLEVARRLEVVRDDLRERQRKAFTTGSTRASAAIDPVSPTPHTVTPRQSRRLVAGLARTMSSEPRFSWRRWRWPAGVAMMIASVTVVVAHRRGGATVASASVSDTHQLDANSSSIEVRPPAPVVSPRPVSSVPAAHASGVSLVPPVLLPIVPPHHKIQASRKPPTKPRQAAKIEPDGTIDPYP
jgi:eukaryotic-like serine/threonine-protein kinase